MDELDVSSGKAANGKLLGKMKIKQAVCLALNDKLRLYCSRGHERIIWELKKFFIFKCKLQRVSGSRILKSDARLSAGAKAARQHPRSPPLGVPSEALLKGTLKVSNLYYIAT